MPSTFARLFRCRRLFAQPEMEQAFKRLQSLSHAAIENEKDGLSGLLQDCSRSQIARGEFIDETLAFAIDHDRAGPAARLRHQDIGVGAKRRMDLDLIHVDELGSGLLRKQHPFAGRARLIRTTPCPYTWDSISRPSPCWS